MPSRIIKTRIRFFLAVEGKSEQSLVRWLQTLAEERASIYLDCHPLNGGGFRKMLENAVLLHNKQSRNKGPYRERFLVFDADLADAHDWSLEKLRTEAAKAGFTVIAQRPKFEGLLYRMLPGKECDIPSAAKAAAKLKKFWHEYQKPSNAHELGRRYSLDDLKRVAKFDADLRSLLKRIGLI